MNIFHTIFYQPIFNGLIAIQHVLPGHDLGLAIVIVTIIIRTILIWPSRSQINSQRSLQVLQPKLKELQAKYKDNRQELAKQTMVLYREHKVNPLSSCLPLLIQLPFLFALYQVFVSGLQIDPTTHLLKPERLADLYGSLKTIYATTPINSISLGFIDLLRNKNIIIAVLTGITQYLQTKMLTPTTNIPKVKGAEDERSAATITRQMNYFLPIVTAYFSYIFPAGLGLYILTTNIFSIAQQWLLFRGKAQTEKPTP
ncbi:MAG: membrane protein insertase YidC [Candidatus Kerfeldbacteria bacterium]|nr:membrane protein insertase YidC [Candidatus Kerfeldbacteria bacterium]